MTADERAKAAALFWHVRVPAFGWGASLIKNLNWRLRNNPQAPLTPKEKYLLDLAVWHYRNKLGGIVPFALPEREPQRADYFPAPPPQEQGSLL